MINSTTRIRSDRATQSAIKVFALLGLLLCSGQTFAACGNNGGLACKVWERVPSCDRGLIEKAGRCVAPPQAAAPKPAPVCGAENQRPCLLTERVPSCNAGLTEDFGQNRCIRPAQAAAPKPAPLCGAENQRPCLLTERVPSCNPGLTEDFGQNRCIRPVVSACGGYNLRPCLVTERVPSCDANLVEDFKVNRCLPYSQSSGAEFERFAQQAMNDNKQVVDTLVMFALSLSEGPKAQYFSSGAFMRDVKTSSFNQIETQIGIAKLRAQLASINNPLMPRALTIGLVVDGGVGIAGNVEYGVAVNLGGEGPFMDVYRSFGVSVGLITGGSGSIVISVLKNAPRGIVGEGRGLSFGAGKVINPVTGVSVGGGLGFWFSPLPEFPGAIGFDYRQFAGLSVTVGVGVSVLPVDLRGTAALTQIYHPESRQWLANECGDLRMRPCHIVERVPSCTRGREDFLLHMCVP